MSRRALRTLACFCALAPGVALAQGGAIHGSVSVPAAGIGGVVVYLVPGRGAPPPPPMKAVMDQRDLKFVPRILAVTPGSTVAFTNSDPVMHNVFHPSVHADAFDLGTYPEGERRSFTFAREGAYVIFCHVHPEMIGYVVVVASAHLTVSNANGRFRFESLAPGTYHLRTWHSRLKSLDQVVTVPAGGAVTVHLALKHGAPADLGPLH
jgi:Carboxypeptidase regulatory-like domain/Copper binding proteins, plastocyanin/azurin family